MDQFLENHPEHKNTSQINREIYDTWKTVSEQYGGTFSGEHNGFHAKVKTKFMHHEQLTHIRLSRQLQSAAGSFLPQVSKITTFTYIRREIDDPLCSLVIRPARFMQQLKALFITSKGKIKAHKYLLLCQNKEKAQELLAHPFLESTLKGKQLVKLVIKSGTIKITFQRIFQKMGEIEALLGFLAKLVEITKK